jgi:hypothetical protein
MLEFLAGVAVTVFVFACIGTYYMWKAFRNWWW